MSVFSSPEEIFRPSREIDESIYQSSLLNKDCISQPRTARLQFSEIKPTGSLRYRT
ncbi:hypothetical protein SBDP1_1270010 [Syntrophobacter sp. SbD1]|nr:hypothetical protein SBDP1_1270010 [Syntrophobacter sp. SbD1]